ncbi:MAG: GGDEF domain-containing protein [Proteobacteria bacterium]|nr:GGDEF domain-containing protein [Pseudomonadota bacterium]MBU1715625.1 GGDEF domain-containing protein [Pseudomonadota bacterium]
MDTNEFRLLDMLSLIYEDMDIDAIEERFVSFVAEIFSFDRVALFFVKHRKGILQGKLCKGFEDGTISSIKIPIEEQYLFTRPLITGFPVWNTVSTEDPFVMQLGLTNFAVIPVVNRKRVSCWKIKNCHSTDCPAYGNKMLRCWLVPQTNCRDRKEITTLDKLKQCESCPVYSSQDTEDVEGILLVDNSWSDNPIDQKTVTLLSIVAHSIGIAINNAKAYSSVLRESIHDDLTGLHNRRYFNARLIDEVDRARRYGGNVSLLMIDIDHFKKVNDTHGHLTGDAVLEWISEVFRNGLRKTDLVARYGGEEFTILLLNTPKEKAVEIAESLRRAVAESSLPEDQNVRITISIGVAALGKEKSFESLIRNADQALYNAKSQGRDKVCVN